MKVIIYTDHIVENIKKAETLVNRPISLMFKDFYEDVYGHIRDRVNNGTFSLHFDDSICYSIGKAHMHQKGSVAVTEYDAMDCVLQRGVNNVYIPINAYDYREGVCLFQAAQIGKMVHSCRDNAHAYAMITSGCMNGERPTMKELHGIWDKLNVWIESISLGGSFWLGQNEELPDFISDVRIGEYMLFGTIPYNDEKEKLGKNGIELITKVIAVYPERNHVLLDCGYSMADIGECKCLDGNLSFYQSSSEYTVMKPVNTTCPDYCIGDTISFIPNYKSLVKLRYAEREFR